MQGIAVTIENRAGSIRAGKNSEGTPWRIRLTYDYGFFPGTTGADGDEIDCFLGPDPEAATAFVIRTATPDDPLLHEEKVMLGFADEFEARKAFLENYTDPSFFAGISPLSMDELRAWLAASLTTYPQALADRQRLYSPEQPRDDHGRWGEGQGGTVVQDSPTAFLVKMTLGDDIPAAHMDGLREIKFEEHQYIQAQIPSGKIVEALGIYNPASQAITLSSNKDNVNVIGGATIDHEVGHHVHMAKMTDEAAAEWNKISAGGQHALISAYARTCQGEHFAEAYRAYARGEGYRRGLRNLEPATYKFMASVFQNFQLAFALAAGRAICQARLGALPVNLEQYITAAVRGEILIAGGMRSGHALVEGTVKLNPADPMALTAEAFNQGVFDSDEAWDDARAQVDAALAAYQKSELLYDEAQPRVPAGSPEGGEWGAGGAGGAPEAPTGERGAAAPAATTRPARPSTRETAQDSMQKACGRGGTPADMKQVVANGTKTMLDAGLDPRLVDTLKLRGISTESLGETDGRKTAGEYIVNERNIRLNPTASDPMGTFIHEYGHHTDFSLDSMGKRNALGYDSEAYKAGRSAMLKEYRDNAQQAGKLTGVRLTRDSHDGMRGNTLRENYNAFSQRAQRDPRIASLTPTGPYALMNTREWFAESWTAYSQGGGSREGLKQNFPGTYSHISGIFSSAYRKAN